MEILLSRRCEQHPHSPIYGCSFRACVIRRQLCTQIRASFNLRSVVLAINVYTCTHMQKHSLVARFVKWTWWQDVARCSGAYIRIYVRTVATSTECEVWAAAHSVPLHLEASCCPSGCRSRRQAGQSPARARRRLGRACPNANLVYIVWLTANSVRPKRDSLLPRRGGPEHGTPLPKGRQGRRAPRCRVH